jgi:arylsulfatase A-like enzyme
MIAPQPWIETHLKFYYQMQAEVGAQITRVLDALRETGAHENTIVIFTSDHGDMQGAHGGMHEKWHVAYEEALHVPFIVSSPLLPGGARELAIPTTHADLIPTLLGLTGIDAGQALARLQSDHNDARALVGRDLSQAIRAAEPAAPTEPILFTTDDEISEGNERSASPFHRFAARLDRLSTVKQPNHIQTVIAEVQTDGEQHLVKFSRYYDNQQFWTLPGERDERLRGRHTETVTEPEPDEFELYDLSLDPFEERNLAHPSHADDRSRALQQRMLALLAEQLAAKRLTPSAGEVAGYRPPTLSATSD